MVLGYEGTPVMYLTTLLGYFSAPFSLEGVTAGICWYRAPLSGFPVFVLGRLCIGIVSGRVDRANG